jgi:NTE family protein
VLAVDISQAPEGGPTGDPLRLLLQTFAIMGKSINRLELREADLVLRPALAGMGGSDFRARERALAAGRHAALQQLPVLRQRIAELTR